MHQEAWCVCSSRGCCGLFSASIRLGFNVSGRPWAAHEIELLRSVSSTRDFSDIAERLGRSRAAVQQKSLAMGMDAPSPIRFWTTREVSLLRKHYPECGPSRTAELLGRPRSSVISRSHELGVHFRPRWSAAELEILRARRRQRVPVEKIAAELRRKKSSVLSMANTLRLSSR